MASGRKRVHQLIQPVRRTHQELNPLASGLVGLAANPVHVAVDRQRQQDIRLLLQLIACETGDTKGLEQRDEAEAVGRADPDLGSPKPVFFFINSCNGLRRRSEHFEDSLG